MITMVVTRWYNDGSDESDGWGRGWWVMSKLWECKLRKYKNKLNVKTLVPPPPPHTRCCFYKLLRYGCGGVVVVQMVWCLYELWWWCGSVMMVTVVVMRWCGAIVKVLLWWRCSDVEVVKQVIGECCEGAAVSQASHTTLLFHVSRMKAGRYVLLTLAMSVSWTRQLL